MPLQTLELELRRKVDDDAKPVEFACQVLPLTPEARFLLAAVEESGAAVGL